MVGVFIDRYEFLTRIAVIFVFLMAAWECTFDLGLLPLFVVRHELWADVAAGQGKSQLPLWCYSMLFEA